MVQDIGHCIRDSRIHQHSSDRALLGFYQPYSPSLHDDLGWQDFPIDTVDCRSEAYFTPPLE